METETDVAIVGCGPAGAFLSLLLARSGVRVRVLEQGLTFDREFRGEALQAGTQRIFDDVGLGERLRAIDHGSPQGFCVDIDGRQAVRVEFTQPGLPPIIGVIAAPQPQLLAMIVDAARAQPHFAIEMGALFRDLITEDGCVRGVRYSTHDGLEHTLRAKLVVACDGRFSAVRRAAGLPFVQFFMPYDLVWMATDGNLDDYVHARVTGSDVFFSFPSRAQNTQVGWLIEKGSYPALKARGFESVKSMVVERVPEVVRPLVERSLRSFADLALLPAVSQMVERWWRPGLLLIGDAAHPSSPVGGQGINIAIQDSVVAARTLALAVRAAGVPDTLLASVEAQRRPAIARIQRQQNLFPTVLHLLGPRAVITLLVGLFRTFGMLGWRPPFVQAAIDRFAWGDPPIRADAGPWVTDRPAAERP